MGLDSVEFILEIEKRYSITIVDEEAERLGLVGDIANYIVRESLSQKGTIVGYGRALRDVADLLVDNYGIPRELIHPLAHVVKDLGLD